MMMPNDYYYHKGGAYWYSTGKEPAPPLPFVPLNIGAINQQLAAVRTITAVDTNNMADSKKDGDTPWAITTDIDLSDPSNWYGTGKSISLGEAVPRQIALSGDALEHLQELATSQGITMEEALRKAIATESYLYKEMQAGSKVLLLTADKEVREVLFR
jgi:hypothetical protein